MNVPSKNPIVNSSLPLSATANSNVAEGGLGCVWSEKDNSSWTPNRQRNFIELEMIAGMSPTIKLVFSIL
jgi:hypothetical protein